jgi:hypothetical protein
LALSIVLVSCGSKKSPTGGPEDTEKPVVLTTVPTQYAQIVNGYMEINFSKPLDKTSVLHAVYFYPPVENKKITIDRSTVRINLSETLAEDTNYYLTFTTSLKDTHGNALAENQTFVFANGNFNDRRLAGKFSFEEQTDTSLPVQLTLLSKDSLLVECQTFSAQTYALEALNPELYLVRAYIDKDNNGHYDPAREPYCQKSADVKHTSWLDLNLAYADTTKPVITNAISKSPREIEVIFSKPVFEFKSARVLQLDNRQSVPILITKLKGNKLTLLTEEQAAFAYSIELNGLSDQKGNSTDISSADFRTNLKPDTSLPTVVSTNPRNGTSVNTLQPTFDVIFSEIIPRSNLQVRLRAKETTAEIPVDILLSDSDLYRFQPRQSLVDFRSYVLIISASDISGNKMEKDFELNFLPLVRN